MGKKTAVESRSRSTTFHTKKLSRNPDWLDFLIEKWYSQTLFASRNMMLRRRPRNTSILIFSHLFLSITSAPLSSCLNSNVGLEGSSSWVNEYLLIPDRNKVTILEEINPRIVRSHQTLHCARCPFSRTPIPLLMVSIAL